MKLFLLLALVAAAAADSGYAPPEPAYGAPEPSYAPEPHYPAPKPHYPAPKPVYRPVRYKPLVRYLPIWLPTLKFFAKPVAVPIPKPTLVSVPVRVNKPVPVAKPYPVAKPIPVPVKVHYEVPVLHAKEPEYGHGGGYEQSSAGYAAPAPSHGDHGSSYESY